MKGKSLTLYRSKNGPTGIIAGRPNVQELNDVAGMGMVMGLLRGMHLILPLGDVSLDLHQ